MPLPAFSGIYGFARCVERDLAAAERALAAIPPEGDRAYLGFIVPREWYVGYTARTFNRPETARAAFTATRAIVEKQLRDNPDNAIDLGFARRSKSSARRKAGGDRSRPARLRTLAFIQRAGLGP